MIYYFSGTGNTRFVANKLAQLLHTQAQSITNANPAKASDAEGFLFPVYAWGVPPVVLDFIGALPKAHGKKIWCVLTCGDDTGNAPRMFSQAAGRNGWTVSYMNSVFMPNTYVLLPGFDVDTLQVEDKKIRQTNQQLPLIADHIISGMEGDFCHHGSMPGLKTKLIWPLFKKWGIRTSKFYTLDNCNGCGNCARSCPVRNISMINHRPSWGADCTGCLACFHSCPSNSVQYGTVTKNKHQKHIKI